jgi:glycosyltransferase involved in cell wall biosynthesis
MVKFSIIIPTCRADSLPRTLDSVVELDYSRDRLECLVCDNSTSGEINKLVKNYSNKYPFIKHIKANEKKSSYYARNAGVRGAKGEILCFLDDDCAVYPNWLKKLEQEFSDQEISVVKIRREAGYDNIWDFVMWGKDTFCFEKKFHSHSENLVFSTDSTAIRKSMFERIGFFEEILRGADVIFSKHIIKQSLKYSYLKNPPIKHYANANFTDFAGRSFAYGFNSVSMVAHSDLLEKRDYLGLIKEEFPETAKYLGGYKYLFPLFLYAIFRMAGMLSAKLNVLRENPIK